MSKHFVLISVLIFLFLEQFQTSALDTACGVGWLPYKDENCLMILDGSFQTFAEAEKSCAKLDNAPTLPIIHSQEEQQFLSDYLFKTNKKVDSFWLGAKFSTSNNGTFQWIDNSPLDYTNWDTRENNKKESYCIQIQADAAVVGKWVDEPCEKKNAVVCQKMQIWSIAKLQKAFLDERKQHKDALEVANRKIDNLTHNLESTKVRLNSTEIQIDNNKKNPVPIGFIYIQLSNQPEPATLLSTVEWKDVTSEYARLFFRAEGGNSTQFGTVQEGNAPRVTKVELAWFKTDQSSWGFTELIVGGVGSSIGVYAGSYYDPKNLVDHHTHIFHQSGGEVRPRNTAMRIWKRFK